MLNKNRIKEYLKPLFPIQTDLSKSGKPKEKIKCVLFDIYGTLFISGSGDISLAGGQSHHTELLDGLFKKFSIKKNPGALKDDLFKTINEEHEKMKNNGVDFPEVEIDRIWMKVLKNYDPETVRNFAVEYELIVNPVYPMPNLKEVISGLGEKKIVMGIISNAQFFTPYLFDWFLGADTGKLGLHPDLIFYSYQHGYAKPSSFLFEAAGNKLKNIGLHARSVLYIGNDMLNDIYPAQKNGFQTALFAGDTRSLRVRTENKNCRNLLPDLTITDLIQLLEFV